MILLGAGVILLAVAVIMMGVAVIVQARRITLLEHMTWVLSEASLTLDPGDETRGQADT